jgi:AcrR family transcriptional regulator
MVKDTNTEQKILDAARKVFMQKGMAGARMQEIADEAGINKALLHYYFRSKDRLFEHILDEVVTKISEGISSMFTMEMTVIERLSSFIDIYIDTIKKNLYLPIFVLTEINTNPERFATMIRQKIVPNMGGFILELDAEIKEGKINPIHPLHLISSVLGMVIFPFAVYPLIKAAITDEYYGLADNFLEERKDVVKEFVINALTPKNHDK